MMTQFREWIRTRESTNVLRDAFIVSLGQIGSALGALLTIRIFTETLEPTILGSLTLIFGIVMFGQGLAVNPVMQALLRYYAPYARTGDLFILRVQAIGILKKSLSTLIAVTVLASTGYG